MSRRRAHLGGSATLALCLVAASCGSTGAPVEPPTSVLEPATSSTVTTSQSSTTATPVLKPYGGEVVVATDREPEASLNPWVNALGRPDDFAWLEFLRIDNSWLVGPVRHSGTTLEAEPYVLEFIPTESNGGLTTNTDGTMTVHFEIRESAVWEDGTPISGADFAFTHETIASLDWAARNIPWQLEQVVETSFVVEAKAFEFTMRAPSRDWVYFFSPLIPRHQIEGTDFVGDWNDRAWLSGGPFRFEAWVPESHMSFVRNENYWDIDPVTGQALPYLDRVTFLFIEREGMIDALGAGAVDVAYLLDTPQEEAAALDETDLFVDRTPGLLWEHLSFQFGEHRRAVNPDSVSEHLLFRRAVALAIDRERLTKEVNGTEPIDGYLELSSPTISNRPWSQWNHDPDRARALLDELCTALKRDCEGNPLQLTITSTDTEQRRATMRLLDEMLARVGVDVETLFTDTLRTTVWAGPWDAIEFAFGADPGLWGAVSAHVWFDPADVGNNYMNLGTPAIEDTRDDPGQAQSAVFDTHTERLAALISDMATAGDEGKIQALLQEAESILADQVYLIPLYARSLVGAARRDLAGWAMSPLTAANSTDTWNIDRWYWTPETG